MKTEKGLDRLWLTGVMLSAGILATVIGLPHARGDLVLEGDDREATREVVKSSENLKATNTVEGTQEVAAQRQVEPAMQAASALPAANAGSGDGVTASFSQSELMRRERQRQEIKNEDLLQVRLEQLRLRDEKRRTRALLNDEGLAPDEDTGAAATGQKLAQANGNNNGAMQVETVGAAAVDRPGQGVQADRVVTTQAAAVPAANASVGTADGANDSGEKTQIWITPRAGISNFLGSTFFQTNPKFNAGIGFNMMASENLAVEAGYTYGETGVASGTYNGLVAQYQNYYGAYSTNRETLSLRQNTFDLGARLYLLGKDSKVRPFVGGGAAYSMGSMNYSSQIQQYLQQIGAQAYAQDYSINQFLGFLSVGLDLQISKKIAIGAMFRYYTVLSATESNRTPYYYYYGAGAGTDQAIAAASLAREPFYSLLLGVSFQL